MTVFVTANSTNHLTITPRHALVCGILLASAASTAHAMLPTPTNAQNEPVSGQLVSAAAAQANAQTAAPVVSTATPAQAVAAAQANRPPINTQIVRTPNTTAPAAASQMPANTQTVSGTVGGNALSANVGSVGSSTFIANSQDVATAIYAYLVQADGSLAPLNATSAIKSGDVIEYHGYFTNRSPDRIRTMTAMMSIADGMELVGNLSPSFAFASIDGSRFARMPIKASVNGVVQELPLSYYKGLRWDIEDVGLNGTAVVKYRAKMK
ncbi:MAG: hypothetical protein Q4G13_00665 [Moraxella sp.]|nr:hypothetical protein [Moraxella sp.]